MGCVDRQPEPHRGLIKDLTDHDELEAAVLSVAAERGAAFVETDMRAHRNPTRMSAIERAAKDLVQRF